VVFCAEIEYFVTAESTRVWCNHGVHEKALSTYCFLVRYSILQRLGHVLVRRWRGNIHGMLRNISSVSTNGLDAYFATINSKLEEYENLSDAPMFLELAIWKSKITQQLGMNNDPHPTEMRKKRRIDSVSMVTIIVPNVLSFV
jgi:hypothetical protein